MPYYGQQNLSGIGSFAEGLAGGVRGLVGMKTQQREQQQMVEQQKLLEQQKKQQAELKQKADNIQQQLSLSANKDLPPSMRRKALTSALGGMREFNPDMPDYELTDDIFESKAVSNGLSKLTGFLEKNPNASYEEKNQVAMGWLSTVVDELSAEDQSKTLGLVEQLVGDKPEEAVEKILTTRAAAEAAYVAGTATPEQIELINKTPKETEDKPPRPTVVLADKIAQIKIDKAAGKELTPEQQALDKKELTSTQLDSLRSKTINDFVNFAPKWNKTQTSEVAYLNPTTEVTGFYQLDEGMIAAGYTPEMMEMLAKAAGVPTAAYLKMRFGVDTGFVEEEQNPTPKKNVTKWWTDLLSGKSN